jgi:hypothetical protein
MDHVQEIWIWGLTVAATVAGWFLRQLWSAVQDLKKDVKDLEVDLVRNYISYDRLHDVMQPIADSLNEIKETLKGKADK